MNEYLNLCGCSDFKDLKLALIMVCLRRGLFFIFWLILHDYYKIKKL